MPSIDNFVAKDSASKKFKKVAHRPWTVISSLNEGLDGSDNAPHTPEEVHAENLSVEASTVNTTLEELELAQDLELKKSQAPYPAPIGNSKTIHEQFKNNSRTIGDQLENNLETNVFQNCSTTVPEQFINSLPTEPEQFVNIPQIVFEHTPNSSQTISKQVLESLNNNHGTVHEQFINSSQTKLPNWNYNQNIIEYAKLVGFQKQVFLYIAKRCIANDSLVTGPISKQDLKENISSDIDTIKTSLQRLVQKGFIHRELSKSGTGGFSIFSISSPIKKLVLDDFNLQSVHEQFANKPRTNLEQPDYSSSSYNNIYNKTTNLTQPLFTNGLPIVSETNDEPEIALSDGWEEIDISNLEFIGFSKNHLSQLQKRSELSVEIIQDSINAFAFDLKHNGVGEKIKTHPLNYFMGILRSNQPYAAPSNYQDPKVLAMREYLERKKQIRDDKKKLEEEIFQFEFEEWQEGLSDELIAEIIPEARYREYPMKEGFLKTHFRKNIWEPKHKNVSEPKVWA